MKNNDRFLTFLGLAMKAGKIVSGEFACEKALAQGSAKLIILAEDASQNTQKKFINACRHNNRRYVFYDNMESLGNSIGKSIRSIVAVTNQSFADRLMEIIELKDDYKTGGDFNE